MAETGEKKTNKRKERGVNVRVVQAPKLVLSEDVHVNAHQKKVQEEKIQVKEPELKIQEEKIQVKEPELKVQEEKPQEQSDFEEFKIAEITTPKKLDSKILLRDVEKTPIVIRENINHPAKKEVNTTIAPPAFKIIKAKPVPKLNARDIKEQEIKKALKKADKLPQITPKTAHKRSVFGEFGWTRAILAIACTATAIFAAVYFVNLASADMSIQVAAIQSGIDATYPSYIPRGYNLSDVTSMSGKIAMHFRDSENNSFGITEETSSWDSSALLNEYIKPTYGDSYVIVREQGLTLYMGDNWEVWVNGGTLYKLTVESGSLTKKQMKSIAVSL